MKVVGFTFIRNAVKYDYPIEESIKSILPICDQFIVAVGKSEDNTRSLIASIDPLKIKIIDTEWDDSLREGGRVLALETDKAYHAIDEDTDWCFYIQGDEVVHEKYLPVIKQVMVQHLNNPSVDGLLFKYLHFYGSYDYIGTSPKWYSNEIRIIRKQKKIYSYRDAQSFRKDDNKKLNVKPIDAYIYHYGWVKEPKAMQKKQQDFNKLWHSDEWVQQNVTQAFEFDYKSKIDALTHFEHTHPNVMKERISSKNWTFDYDITFNNLKWKYRLKLFLKNKLGIDTGFNNYHKI